MADYFGIDSPNYRIVDSEEDQIQHQYPVYVMGSGRGSLFVPEMDSQAFPLIIRERLLLKISRRAVRWILGLNMPKTES